MKPPSTLRIAVSRADGNKTLVMTLERGSQCDSHQISLAQARALSLELIKQAYLAELRSRLGDASVRLERQP